MLRAITVLHFPICAQKKLSRTCCTCSRGGSLFLSYPIQPHPLSPLIMVRLKMTSLETFQSNMIKNTTKRCVDCNAVSWFGKISSAFQKHQSKSKKKGDDQELIQPNPTSHPKSQNRRKHAHKLINVHERHTQ